MVPKGAVAPALLAPWPKIAVPSPSPKAIVTARARSRQRGQRPPLMIDVAAMAPHGSGVPDDPGLPVDSEASRGAPATRRLARSAMVTSQTLPALKVDTRPLIVSKN